MVASTEIKKRRVMERDHADIANFIMEELKRRKGTEWRKKHEPIWAEVDRQIAMEAPVAVDEAGNSGESGEWHNAIQLGDLTDASETLTADTMRLIMPTERKFFVPHVELPFDVDENGDPVPVPPERQRQANGIYRNLLVQQHKDFGVRGRIKLGIKEILHHGSVVITVEEERMRRFEGGSTPNHLKAPVPVVHSMWNCYPDSSPRVFATETFYTGTMLIKSFVRLKDALENPNWINKKKLQAQHHKKDLDDHIEVLTFYGDIFLKRHDGNILFPNRTTVVSGNVFLDSKVNKTAYPAVIYTGYERDDVRDPYYTSPIVKRAPMGKFTTHMLNKTMDSIDLKVKPPTTYDSQDNSLKGNGPEIFPGAKIASRGNAGITVLDLGSPEAGLAGVEFGRRSIQEGTTVDPVRKGVSPGTEQTATEVVKTEQRAEVREVEFVANVENELLLPYLIMQHDMNLDGLEDYRFYNDEPHTPDFGRARKQDIPKSVIMEVTGSRTLLGEEQRTARFINTVTAIAQLPPLAQNTDWSEVGRQMWEDTKVKDPERFLSDSSRNAEVQRALEAQQAEFQQVIQQVQQQAAQLQEQAQKAQDDLRKAQAAVQEAGIQEERQKLDQERVALENKSLQEQIKLANQLEQAEKRLRATEDRIEKLQAEMREEKLKLECERQENNNKREKDDVFIRAVERLTQ